MDKTLPLKTTKKIDEERFIEAVYRNYDNSVEGLMLVQGAELENRYKEFIKIPIKDAEWYIILDSVDLALSSPSCFLKLDKLRKEFYSFNFIAIYSVLPGMILNNCELGDWIIVESILTDDLALLSTQLGHIEIRENSTIKDIQVLFGSGTGDISITGKSRCADIEISSGSQIASLRLNDKSESFGVYIGEKSQAADITISEYSRAEYITLSDHSFCAKLNVSVHSQIRNIYIGSFSQGGNISIHSGSQIDHFEICENSQSGDIDCSYSIINKMSISDLFAAVFFKGSTIQQAYFTHCHIRELQWQAGSKGELYINNSSLTYLNFKQTALLKDTLFLLNDVLISVALFEESTIQGQLILRHIQPCIQGMQRWNSKISSYKIATESASGLEKKFFKQYVDSWKRKQATYDNKIDTLEQHFSAVALFRIANSSLGKTEITGSDLSAFRFEYRDSKLIDCFISSTKLPRASVNIYQQSLVNHLPDRDYYEQKISFYNQLRKLFDSQGDVIEASWYQSKAMDSQQKLLQFNFRLTQKSKWFSIHKWFSEEGFDLLTFHLNKVSNNHGESWRKALFFILFASLLLYSAYYASIFHSNRFSLFGTGQFLGDYFTFLDITHKADFLVGKTQLTPLSKLIDFVSRLITGYGIFQFVTAFRRHARKVST